MLSPGLAFQCFHGINDGAIEFREMKVFFCLHKDALENQANTSMMLLFVSPL